MYKVIQVDNMGLVAYDPQTVKDHDGMLESDSFVILFVKEIDVNQWTQMPPNIKNNNTFYKLKEENGGVSILFINKMNESPLIKKDDVLTIQKKYIISSYTMNEEVEKWVRSKLSNIIIAQPNSTPTTENVIKFPG